MLIHSQVKNWDTRHFTASEWAKGQCAARDQKKKKLWERLGQHLPHRENPKRYLGWRFLSWVLQGKGEHGSIDPTKSFSRRLRASVKSNKGSELQLLITRKLKKQDDGSFKSNSFTTPTCSACPMIHPPLVSSCEVLSKARERWGHKTELLCQQVPEHLLG